MTVSNTDAMMALATGGDMLRLRIKFRRAEELKFISHLDIIRLWVRALRRARIPLEYSEGFTPHPRISLAVPLSVGVTADNELMDVFITRAVSPHWFVDAVNRQLPQGMEVLEASPIGLTVPSLQSQIRFVQYQIEVNTEKSIGEIKRALDHLLSLENLPWHHERDTGRRSYDLRALIDDIWLIGCQPLSCTLGMRLRCDESGSGRPEQVISALGFTEYPKSIRRTKLILGMPR
ncbi:MAG: TIGR03936 family radical SAM-associated protein [Chloroflexi bacterium]|nr:TIGR03936 family radical SAM-associated protein [Chloroflexota bacterium]